MSSDVSTTSTESVQAAPSPNQLAGRFADAVRTLEKAIEISREQGDEASVREFADRLALYRARRAYVEATR